MYKHQLRDLVRGAIAVLATVGLFLLVASGVFVFFGRPNLRRLVTCGDFQPDSVSGQEVFIGADDSELMLYYVRKSPVREAFDLMEYVRLRAGDERSSWLATGCWRLPAAAIRALTMSDRYPPL
jgi:hypothetical protein